MDKKNLSLTKFDSVEEAKIYINEMKAVHKQLTIKAFQFSKPFIFAYALIKGMIWMSDIANHTDL